MFCLLARRFRDSGDKADVPGARQLAETFEADACQGGSLRVGKDLLAGLDLDHAFILIINLREGRSKERRSKNRPIVRGWNGVTARAAGPVFVALVLLVRTIADVCGLSIEWGQ